MDASGGLAARLRQLLAPHAGTTWIERAIRLAYEELESDDIPDAPEIALDEAQRDAFVESVMLRMRGLISEEALPDLMLQAADLLSPDDPDSNDARPRTPPAASAWPPTPPRRSTPPPSTTPGRPRVVKAKDAGVRVLVVDPRDGSSRATQAILALLGESSEAVDAVDLARTRFDAQTFEVVIIDGYLAPEEVDTFIRWLRDHARGGIGLRILSTHAPTDTRTPSSSIAAGANASLTKPLSRAELAVALAVD